ncbi:hypothetical protein Goshw_016015 [Gossypium schwendimanii]|uniref:Uncharacterized protein n=1 Tax=Gossypium schwendimanii TaxID=34291 RepID=A0A7J9L3R2_GOSSC|nr:hypothetical protein [Gossypium schwendimanii]
MEERMQLLDLLDGRNSIGGRVRRRNRICYRISEELRD